MSVQTNFPQSIYLIGVTGTIASGKSTVGQILASRGIPVLDTDQVVADLYRDDTELIQAIGKAFGEDVVTPAGEIDRARLRPKVFGNPDRLRQLEALVHPRVREATRRFRERQDLPGGIRAVLVPLLFEGGTESLYDEVWAVTTRPDVLLERLTAREGIERAEAELRLSRQWPQEEKARRAQRVIDNSGDFAGTEQQVLAALNAIKKIRETHNA